MKNNLNLLILLLLSIISGCQFSNQEVVIEKIDPNFRNINVEDFRVELPGYFADQLGEFEKARINNYDVEFVGRNVEKIDGRVDFEICFFEIIDTAVFDFVGPSCSECKFDME